MRVSVGGGISGAAARAAGPESLSPRERPENACVERVLRMFDGNGFSESDKVGRPIDPKPETIQYKEREQEREAKATHLLVYAGGKGGPWALGGGGALATGALAAGGSRGG